MLESLMTTCSILGFQELDHDIIKGTVGPDVATKFAEWARNNDIPDPEDLLSGKLAYSFDATRLDRNLAVYMSCARFLKDIPREDLQRRNTYGARGWNLLEECAASGASDVVVEPASILSREGYAVMETRPELADVTKAANSALSKMKVLLG